MQQNYAIDDDNKNNLYVSNLHFYQQGNIAQLVERLALDPEARVRILVRVNFLNK